MLISSARKAGARGYLLKSTPPQELVETIRRVHAGKKGIPQQIAARLAEHIGDEFLTEREIEVLRLVAGGNRNRDVAEKLFISEETVKVHSSTSWTSWMPATAHRPLPSPSDAGSFSCNRRGIIQLSVV